eukprot:15484666-Alexandrium_andersonii.AAC.1
MWHSDGRFECAGPPWADGEASPSYTGAARPMQGELPTRLIGASTCTVTQPSDQNGPGPQNPALEVAVLARPTDRTALAR